MKKIHLTICFMIFIVLAVYGAKEANDLNNWRLNNQAVFITDENNVRSSPNVKSSLVDVPPKGTNCEILDQKDRWFKVRFGSKTGWTNRINLKLVNNSQNKSLEKKEIVVTNNLNEATEKKEIANNSSEEIEKEKKGSAVDIISNKTDDNKEYISSNNSNDIFVIKELNLEMVKCPAGSFTMGSPEKDYRELKETYGNEHIDIYGFEYGEKSHQVTISKPFYLGKYEITQGQFETILGYNPCNNYSAKGLGKNYPVYNISYKDAKDFCKSLNIKYKNILPKGYIFDLPTEAQWEYACKAGTATSINNGKNMKQSEFDSVCNNLDEVAWYKTNSNGITHIVGQKKPNAWGIYDMHGNVSEYCVDWYGEYSSKAVTDPSGINPLLTIRNTLGEYDPDTANKRSKRVYRGGSFVSIPNNCRSGVRGYCKPENKYLDLGLRVALVSIEKNDINESKEEKLSNNWVLDEINLEMVKCPAGVFFMGSPTDEYGREGREEEEGSEFDDAHDLEKRHGVVISKDFYIGKFEITQKQYEFIMGKNSSQFRGESLPVDGVNWLDAKNFCEKLNEKYKDKLPNNYKFDLPTEAQWEYACRAGTNTSLNNGKNSINDEDSYINLNEVAWCAKNSSETTHVVGQKKPNAWGIYDMHGNVCEWCKDYYGEYLVEQTIDPQGPSISMFKDDTRVFRGGHYLSDFGVCRSASRDGSDDALLGFGFRVCLVSNEKNKNEVWILKRLNLEMVKCPAGSFIMGSHNKEIGREPDSEEQHRVTISKPFYISKFEITQKQFDKLMGSNPSRFKGSKKPVENVSWSYAKAFVKVLNDSYFDTLPYGYKFDLPTEAQWEYACRAGTTTSLNNNKNLTTPNGFCPNLDEVGWYRKNSNNTTHEGGQKLPNLWGIYDMHGNVSEWCKDIYTEDFSKEDVIDPYNSGSGDDSFLGNGHVSRGGCWNFEADHCRSAYRWNKEIGKEYTTNPSVVAVYDYAISNGIRVVLVPVE